jgi:hypothetical protein
MGRNTNPPTPEAATDERASSLGFAPVPVRARHDGWTPQKQREFVEELADTGCVRAAAAKVGMTEQSASRLRRRPDARAFNLVCEAALHASVRRIRAIAWERAVEGTVRRHYYHGELKSEEVVYDNRLLVYLLSKAEKLIERPAVAASVLRDWEGWMGAVEKGLDKPAEAPREPEEEWNGMEVWETDGRWWTAFPPPVGFEGEAYDEPDEYGYRRTLSPEEQAVIDADLSEDELMEEDPHAVRDRYFGFEGGRFFSPGDPNL